MIKWRQQTGEYQNGEDGYLGHWKVFSISWDSSRPRDNKTPHRLGCMLPGVKSDLGLFAEIEEAKERSKGIVTRWVSKAGFLPGTAWRNVKDELPEGKYGIPGYEYMSDVVLVIHSDRADYPITAHAILGDYLSSRGVCIPTNGASKFKEIAWFSASADLQNPFSLVDQDYSRFLPNRFGHCITHWKPIVRALIPATWE